ncbi:unnamed protein product [Meganyctiphanes norvegica]|uniref:p53 DNA-binding domain-containing protein n=1 Tax=Meganyctiphanes norvegica TaxID=48144 RepID=A0AAV2Q7Y5_MEGNR
MAKKFGDGCGDGYSAHSGRSLYSDGGQHVAGETTAGGDGATRYSVVGSGQVVGVNTNYLSFNSASSHTLCPPPPPPPYRAPTAATNTHMGATNIHVSSLTTNSNIPFISLHAMNAMERSNTEPLLAEDEFTELIRDNSLLNRTGSGIFSQLLAESPQPLHVQMTQQDHQYAQVIPYVEVQNDQCETQSHQIHLQQQTQQQPSTPQPQLLQEQQEETLFPQDQLLQISPSVWDNLGENLEDSGLTVSLGPSSEISLVNNDFVTVSEGLTFPGHNTNTTPSIMNWPGRYAFQISMPTDNKERNKWCYSSSKSKLYVCPNISVPINVSVNDWISDGSITITPIYERSKDIMEPVSRCFNCKNIPMCEASLVDHVVQVDGEAGRYEIIGERHQVSVPLQSPQMGELTSTILVKVMCLTSCVGGPNRRPFILRFTLKNKDGEELGRQILDMKCCKCPSRDMTNEEKQHSGPRSVPQAPRLCDEKRAKVRKLASEIVVGQQKKKPRIKLEPGAPTQFVNVLVPVQFESEVKRYVNQLIAEDYVKQTNPQLLMYPEDEDSN